MIFPDDIDATMYTLEIIDSILKNDKTFDEDPSYADVWTYKDVWIERFLEQDGVDQLQILLEKAIKGNNKRFLDFMLQIMKIVSMALIKAHYDNEQAESMHVLKK